jgi:hypothetical protein
MNGDGVLDIYVSNIATKFGLTESHSLAEHRPPRAMERGVAPTSSKLITGLRSGWAGLPPCRFSTTTACRSGPAVGFIKDKSTAGPSCKRLARATTTGPRPPAHLAGLDSRHDLNPSSCAESTALP